MFLFVHGWGFGPGIWDGVGALLGGAGEAADIGYFGAPRWPADDGRPMIAVGHSLGVLKLLRRPPANCLGLVAINGFDRFAGEPPAVPVQVVNRMIARFREQPEQVLGEFRRRCGDDTPAPVAVFPERLLTDLELLRDVDERATAARLACPVLVLQGEDDVILPPEMRAATFAGNADVERHALKDHGHLLPLTAPEWCADHIRAFAARLGRPL